MTGTPPDLKRTRRQSALIDLSQVDRLPPHSTEAEQGTIGCMLLEPLEAIGAVVEKKVPADAFYDLRHQELFVLLLDMWDAREAIDLVTVRQKLKDAGKLEAVGGISYLTSLVDTTPSAANLPFYADIVLEKHLCRRMIQTCSNVIGRIYAEAEQGEVQAMLDDIERDLMKLSQDRAETPSMAMKDLVHRAVGRIEEMHNRQGKPMGLPTGLADLDKITGGLQKGEMIVIAARPSVGKSSIAMQIAEHVAMEVGEAVGVFSLEMTADSLVMRTLCSRARVNLRQIQDGFMAERDFPKITTTAGQMMRAKLYIDDTAGLSIMQLRAKARRMAQQFGVKLLVIDYLQLLKGSSKNSRSRQEEVSEISQGIKALAKELNIPVIVLAQLNREMEKRGAGDKPKLSDLRESGSIEQDADLVGMLYRPQIGKDDDQPQGDHDCVPTNLLIAKQRTGPTGDLAFVFNKSQTRFTSVSRIAIEDEPEFAGKTPRN